MMIDHAVIVFSGFNQRAVIAFIRTLEKNKVDYAIIAKSVEDEIFITEYSHRVLSIRKTSKLDINDILTSLKEVSKRLFAKNYLIAPSTESLNRFLLKNRSIIENNDCTIPLVEEKLYNLISDKESFCNLCSGNGIAIPAPKNIMSDTVPLVAKPKKYFSRKNKIFSPIIITNDIDKEEFLKLYNTDDFFYQEFVDGESYYLLYYVSRKGTFYKYSQKNLMQQPEGKSIVAAVGSDFHMSQESIHYENLLLKINFFGLIMIEVKKTNENYIMIEANPRFWGPSQLFVDAGINLFDFFLHDYNIIKRPTNNNKIENDTKYFWFEGIVKTKRENKKLIIYKESETEIFENLHYWMNNDVYLRKDTAEYFVKSLTYA